VLAIIDGGFALDTTTGAPLNGNPDFEGGETPVQLSEPNRGHNAGGTNPGRCSQSDPCPWHGTGVFSVAAAQPRNQFGSAGTGSDIVKPYLIRVNVAYTFDVAQAIADAVLLEPPADVINLSYSVPCGEFCSVFYDFEPLSQAINFARGYNNAVVVAVAGNDGEQGNNPPRHHPLYARRRPLCRRDRLRC
jgi:subtilisin family serine protease